MARDEFCRGNYLEPERLSQNQQVLVVRHYEPDAGSERAGEKNIICYIPGPPFPERRRFYQARMLFDPREQPEITPAGKPWVLAYPTIFLQDCRRNSQTEAASRHAG